MSLSRRALLIFLHIYRGLSLSLSFLAYSFGVPYQCKYPISCSEYAQDRLKHENSLCRALILIVRRLLSCGPWAK